MLLTTKSQSAYVHSGHFQISYEIMCQSTLWQLLYHNVVTQVFSWKAQIVNYNRNSSSQYLWKPWGSSADFCFFYFDLISNLNYHTSSLCLWQEIWWDKFLIFFHVWKHLREKLLFSLSWVKPTEKRVSGECVDLVLNFCFGLFHVWIWVRKKTEGSNMCEARWHWVNLERKYHISTYNRIILCLVCT